MKTMNRFFKKPASLTMEAANGVTTDKLSNHDQPNAPEESNASTYRDRFLTELDAKARSGKLVYVRKEYHERISRIIQVIGENDASLYGFIDNVLTEHFTIHKDEITELYQKFYKPVF